MKQVVIQGGEVRVIDAAAPSVGRRSILVRVAHSCISTGTEVAGLNAASESMLTRALRHPQRILQAVEMARARGLQATLGHARGTTVISALGYSAAGVIIATGEEVDTFAVGGRVACAGAGIANHAEIIDVPVNLAARIPDQIGTEAASTVALGAIALQGVRRAAPTIGETVLVVGLGLLGQITAQLLKASGCTTIGVDPISARIEIARTKGLDQAISPDSEGYERTIQWLTGGRGVDAVIVTAATRGSELVNLAVKACRRKGRIVLVGDVGLQLERSGLYAKELDVLISTSYGPGRYDADYEQHGIDYPYPYVRWTENRNMMAYLDLLASGAVRIDHLVPEIIQVEHAREAYALLNDDRKRPLIVILGYAKASNETNRKVDSRRVASKIAARETLRVGFVGVGAFAQSVHLPNFVALKELYDLRAVVSRSATSARAVADRIGARYGVTDIEFLLADDEIDLVVIATRHDSHAQLALAALKSGKHVFVEKPLALLDEDLKAIEHFYENTPNAPVLMTGFNRRFSPPLQALQLAVKHRRAPLMANYRMNAGYLPPEHWVHGSQGGGRNLGEACHIYDAFAFLTGAPSARVEATSIDPPDRHLRRDDNFVATIRYQDGSVCTLLYTALGAGGYPKERMEVFCDGRVYSLDDYLSLETVGSKQPAWNAKRQDKGHLAELRALHAGIRGGAWPIPLCDQLDASRVGLSVQHALFGKNPELRQDSV